MKIVVDSLEEKEELIKESEYIHDFCKIIKYRNYRGDVKDEIISLDSD